MLQLDFIRKSESPNTAVLFIVMSKVLRRSDRIQAKRGVKKEAEITIEERVFHDAFLWMEIAQWDLEVFRKLSKITTAMSKKRHTTVDDFASHRKSLVKKMLFVDGTYICSNMVEGGSGYVVTLKDRLGDQFNPFGPTHYHCCKQTLLLMFRDAQITEYDRLDGYPAMRFATAPKFNWRQATAGQRVVIEKAVEAYRTNPFADIDLSELFN